MKILVNITDSISAYLNNVAAAYKRVELKGNLPEDLKKQFETQLIELAVTVDKIRKHVNNLPER